MRFFFVTPLFLVLMSCAYVCKAQITVDTIRSANPEHPDTIVIYEEPVVLSSKLEVYRPKITKRKSTFFISIDAGVNYNFEYNNICPDCIAYADKNKSATEKLAGYVYALQFDYSKGNWMIGFAVGGNQQRENFRYKDTNYFESRLEDVSTRNKINSLDGKISLGYWFGKNNKRLSVIPSVMIGVSKPYEIKGRLYVRDSTTTDDMGKVLDFNSIFYSAGVETKVLYKVKENFYISIIPSYSYDIRSIVNRVGPYTIQRHIPALRIGLMVGLK